MSAPTRNSRARDEILTLQQVLDELTVSRETFYKWRRKNDAPKCFKIPNGEIRVKRSALDAWIDEHMEGR